jgi:hypothetical protein
MVDESAASKGVTEVVAARLDVVFGAHHGGGYTICCAERNVMFVF